MMAFPGLAKIWDAGHASSISPVRPFALARLYNAGVALFACGAFGEFGADGANGADGADGADGAPSRARALQTAHTRYRRARPNFSKILLKLFQLSSIHLGLKLPNMGMYKSIQWSLDFGSYIPPSFASFAL